MKLIPIQRFTVFGDSMIPTLKLGQDVLVLCWFYKLEVGDLVAIKINGREMVKRISKINDRQKMLYVLEIGRAHV